jgi:hypothetical protein
MNILNNINFSDEIDNQNKLIISIFNNIKLQDWDNLKDIIKYNNIDYNIKDNSGIYLLEYLILFNKIDIIEIILNKNIRVDVVIENGKSILYTILKFSYIDILKLFIQVNKKNISKNIFEIVDDDKNIPLFYAINFNNLECIKLVLENMSSFSFRNKMGENSLFLSIRSKNIDIFQLVYNKYSFNILTLKNINEENIFHIIIESKAYNIFNFLIDNIDKHIIVSLLNSVNYNNLSILHYIFIYFDYEFLNILNNKNLLNDIHTNIQDKDGNIFYHYFINNIINLQNIDFNETKNIISMIDIINKIKFNYNLYNIDGNLPGHILATNIDFFNDNKLNIVINNVLINSNLNIQNLKGDSILFLLIKANYWKNIKNILINKKLNIFKLDYNNKTFFDFINNKNLPDFIEIITDSYLNIINNSDKIFIDENDNFYKKELLINKKKCYDIIYDKIQKNINTFIKNKNVYDISSYPKINKFNKIIEKYKNISSSTYTGSTLDVFCGLLYLSNKFNKNNILITSLELFKKSNNIISCNNINKKICEIKGFEVLWKNQSLYFPMEIEKIISNNNHRFFIIPISIEFIIDNNIYFHANYLLFDIKYKEVERFEPHGSEHPTGFNYNSNLLDYNLINIFNSFNFTYIPPYKFLTKIGFQKIEINELDNTFYGDPNGFCSLWCIWWADMRLSNINIPRYKLNNILISQLINEHISFKQFIRNYSIFITDIRDNLLTKANTNNNEWMNDVISEKNINKLNTILLKNI